MQSDTTTRPRRTHCKRGHPFTADNTRLRPDKPGRECWTCHNEWTREYLSRRAKPRRPRNPRYSTANPTYQAWSNMLQRCSNPKDIRYARYGGRGITVCERWRSFRAFSADMGERPDRTSLDRIDNDGNYEPGNCRWATRHEQARNTGTNRLITLNGKTATVVEWAERTELKPSTIYARLKRGWSVERALTRPARIWRL